MSALAKKHGVTSGAELYERNEGHAIIEHYCTQVLALQDAIQNYRNELDKHLIQKVL